MTQPVTPPPALATRGLLKRFGSTVAAAGIDLDVPAGSFFGLVGPNGAGKTTTLAMSTGLLRPDAGEVWVQGLSVWREPLEAKRRLGVLPEGLRLFERLTGRELLVYTGLLRRLPRDLVESRAAELLDVVGLADAADTMVVDYSTGMRKKVALASALLHAPRVLVLDEPFEAVDPVSSRTIRAVLRRYVGGGGTVIMSSHAMELVEVLCDHVAILARGRVVAAGSLDEVRAGRSLDEAFVDLVGGREVSGGGLSWLSAQS